MDEHVPRWEPAPFDTAVIERDESGALVLTVKGVAPSHGERSLGARLVPHPADGAEYARVEVELDRADALFLSEWPYTVSLPLDGVAGTKGVEVVGRDGSVTVALP